jgi:methylated-DNA-[protein]-cysteine S-methyltransferase
MDQIVTAQFTHPYGTALVAATEMGVVRIAFDRDDRAEIDRELAALGTVRDDPQALADTLDWLAGAVAGTADGPTPACDLRLVSTPFARDVLAAIEAVPAGRTISYAELAAAAGRPRAVRAAAHVCATNPVPLVIGCHRIVRSDGTAGEYGGGRELKTHLIARERVAATG